MNITEKTMTYSDENTVRDGFRNFRAGVSAPQPVENARRRVLAVVAGLRTLRA